jgi:hypothetical protein
VIRSVALVSALASVAFAQTPATPPIRGLTATAAVARTYDAILNAEFSGIGDRLTETCGPAPPEVCQTLEALALGWQIALEPESRLLDVKFLRTVDAAIAATTAWTARQPTRAEAWFYTGAAYGARLQWRILREERLSAARDGKQVKRVLEQALALDPELHDANFGIGMYRYYADVAPSAVRMLRWLLLLPGGDRKGGLRQILDARDRGQIIAGEADYQLHLIYLWYEKRARDALAVVQDLQQRYPHNPLFHHREAEIHDVYFHDAAASLAASTRLLALAEAARVHDPPLASVRARLNMAVQLNRLEERTRAVELVDVVIAERPSRPFGIVTRAQTLRNAILSRRHAR